MMRKILSVLMIAMIMASVHSQLTAPVLNIGTDAPTIQTYATKNPTSFAEVLCFMWRLIELICVILLLADVISRMSGKALYFIHTSRFIIFTFGASACIYAGFKYAILGTRVYMTIHFIEWLNDMYYNYLGWYLPGKVDYFNVPTKGSTTMTSFMFTNATFYEQLILLLLLLTWGIMKVVLKKEAMMNKVYHLVKSLFLVFFISFMFPLIYYGGLFWRQHFSLGDAGIKRNFFGYWIQWIMLCFWFGVTLFLLWSMFKTVLDPIDGDKTVQANYEQPDFVHERNELTNAESKT